MLPVFVIVTFLTDLVHLVKKTSLQLPLAQGRFFHPADFSVFVCKGRAGGLSFFRTIFEDPTRRLIFYDFLCACEIGLGDIQGQDDVCAQPVKQQMVCAVRSPVFAELLGILL